MPQAAAIAVDAIRGLVAVEDTSSGICAVFAMDSRPPVKPGDILDADVTAHGTCKLVHPASSCLALGLTGSISRLQAVILVGGPPAHPEWTRAGL